MGVYTCVSVYVNVIAMPAHMYISVCAQVSKRLENLIPVQLYCPGKAKVT